MVGVGMAQTWARTGLVAPIVKDLTDRLLLALPALSVTLMVQLL